MSTLTSLLAVFTPSFNFSTCFDFLVNFAKERRGKKRKQKQYKHKNQIP